jgi:CheY-like chemotaxis protein
MARILVVDDDAEVLAVIRRALTRDGHDVVTDLNGEAALEHAQNEDFDLVIVDLVLPGMDGLELMRTLRQRDAELPLLAISGGGVVSKEILLGMAEQLGAPGVLEKPFGDKDLRTAVAGLL